ncbi:hypothetical protein NESM_000930900 [Novymonas esmeraldas]|uniref:Uncharacterized protein n=1 Tax=Novymonas esmeraldas TaxID=1808958 RepID=A0AAW0F1R9_9TRYP
MTLLLNVVCQAAMGEAPAVKDPHYRDYHHHRRHLHLALDGVYATSPMLDSRGHRTRQNHYLVDLVLEASRFGASRYGATQGGTAHVASTTIPESILRSMAMIERETSIPFQLRSTERQGKEGRRQRGKGRKGGRGGANAGNNGTRRLLPNERGPLQRGGQRHGESLHSSRSSSAGSLRGAAPKNVQRANRGGA